MAQVVVLRPGYAYTDSKGRFHAGATVSLVIASDVRLLVDSGGPAERELIVEALARHNLRTGDIDYVVVTHGHIDHVGNLNLFPNATCFMAHDRSHADQFETLDFSGGPLEIAPDVHLMATPGHTSEDLSVLVTTSDGVVAIVGDLFENADDQEGDAWLPFSRDPPEQRRNRAAILARADFIVPGHGDRFAISRRS